MLTFLINLIFASSAAALALPQTTGNSGVQPYPQSTNMTIYTGTQVGSANQVVNCGYAIGKEEIESLNCIVFKNQGIGIQQVQSGSCSFTIFHGSNACESDRVSRYGVDNGNGVQCFETGVLDGGKYMHASGIWTCG